MAEHSCVGHFLVPQTRSKVIFFNNMIIYIVLISNLQQLLSLDRFKSFFTLTVVHLDLQWDRLVHLVVQSGHYGRGFAVLCLVMGEPHWEREDFLRALDWGLFKVSWLNKNLPHLGKP
jgi:hypothetical protein